ncbi:hypothetical protein PACILC2_19210 [Paenibacillus cisolokensis]|uniref:NodB homology domain-containing protein n=1 Tax=Paenibacillus cisolokensis TaxID=1658519 RepID=A0ABQ4N569_9BACL|nr:hypothetical protein [Paenibacillus cisolokensis]GIQ63353.1 hypothetical protein PACILC2_19210 [Paenibacillus cisolokensis]
MRMARIAVLLDRQAAKRRHRYGINVFEAFVGEVLAHAGIAYEWIDGAEELTRSNPDLLIVALAEDDQASADAIWAYAERGGTVISYAGLRALASRMGCYEQWSIPVGYASWPGEERLRFLSATPWEQEEAGAYPAAGEGVIRKERPSGSTAGPALLRFTVGEGAIERWAVNIPQTIVLFQQGTGPVLQDGIPARDGTGAVDEGILKADDRCGMDWEWDRLRTETGAPYFAYPYADLWKERLIGHLLKCARAKGLTVPFLGYWPEGVPAVALISHDSDLNVDESAETTLDVLEECGIRSTWCMIEPGYSPSVYERVKQKGHELAFHYNALEAQQGKWDASEFGRQFDWLKKATGKAEVVSNKNHYTRFEGWGELFAWCEQNGIQADQTRGPSKKGNIGFLFGTCHPYFPIAWFDEANRLYDVLEISFLTQDLDHVHLSDSSVIVPFLEQVARVGGAAHFLFHQIHIHEQPRVTRALRKVVAEARSRGFQFWTSEQINAWERARRKVKVTAIGSDGKVTAEGIDHLNNIVVYIPLSEPDETDRTGAETEIRYGVPCRKVVLNPLRQAPASVTE